MITCVYYFSSVAKPARKFGRAMEILNHYYSPSAQYREWPVRPLNWNFGVRACHITHLIIIMVASQLHFLANKNAELAGRSQ